MTSAPPTPAARPIRTFIVIALAMTMMCVALSTFDYMLVAMQEDLGFAIDSANAVLLIPELGCLALVFLAGTLGDHLGKRRMIAAGAVLFVTGAVLVGTAPSLPVVIVGRVLEGGGAITAAIVALALLGETYVKPRQRSLAFGANAAVAPAVFVIAPLAGAWVVEQMNWRVMGAAWALVGIAALIAALALLPRDPAMTRPEVVTPLLGGLALVGLTGAIMSAALAGPRMMLAFASVTVIAVIALVIAMRTVRRPGLDLRLVRSFPGAMTLSAIVVANTANLVAFTFLLLQFRFDFGLMALAVVMIPVQLLGTLGGLVGGPLMSRFGVLPTGVVTTLLTGLAALFVLPLGAGTAAWVVVAGVGLYVMLDAANTGPFTARVMDLAEPGSEGAAAAHRQAWRAIGSATGGVIAGILVFGTFQTALADNLEQRGVPSATATQLATQVRDGAVAADAARAYDAPPPGIVELTRDDPPAIVDAQFDAYRAAGIISGVGYIVAAALLAASAMGRRRRRQGAHPFGGPRA